LETGKTQLAEGDRLADEGKPNEAQLAYKKAMETLLPGMRGIPFHHPVKNDVTKREDLKQLLLRELDEDKSPQEMRGEALAYRAFGLWPLDLDYKDTIVRVYTEEIAAFYDPTTKTMHLIEEGDEPKSPRPRGLLELLLPKPDGFDKEENKTVIAHELTHALADQHFDIQSMHDQAKGDDDRILALSALIEGEAMLTMMAAMAEDWGGKTTTRLPARDLDRTFGIITPFLSILGGPELRKAPPILSQTMTFLISRELSSVPRLPTEESGPRSTRRTATRPFQPSKSSTPRSTGKRLTFHGRLSSPGWTCPRAGSSHIGTSWASSRSSSSSPDTLASRPPQGGMGIRTQSSKAPVARSVWYGDRFGTTSRKPLSLQQPIATAKPGDFSSTSRMGRRCPRSFDGRARS
jgi:hypothetical protein